ncbi:MAG: hypothetical protein GX802_03605 [Clostridiales bacterium]|nr:hypothetical protein [Clostridiales bacterium]
MLGKLHHLKRLVAVALIIAFSAALLASCSVVIEDPLLIRVGDVEIRMSQYSTMFNESLQTYSQIYDFSKSEDMVKYQDMIFDRLVEYAVLLNQAKEKGVENSLTEDQIKEVDDEVEKIFADYTKSFVDQVKKDEIKYRELNDLYASRLTQEEIDSIPKKVDELVDKEFETYKAKVDESIKGEEEIEKAAKELLDADLAIERITYEDYLREKEEEVRFDLMFTYYAQDKGASNRDKALKEAKKTEEQYKAEARANTMNNKIVEVLQDQIKAEIMNIEQGADKKFYDDKVKEQTDKYKEDPAAFYAAQNAYDGAEEDNKGVMPLVVPDGYTRVIHILLKTPDPSATPAAPTATPVVTEAPSATPDATTAPTGTDEPTDAPAETEAPATTEPTDEPDTSATPEGSPTDTTAPTSPEPTTTVPQEKIDEVQAEIDKAKEACGFGTDAFDSEKFIKDFKALVEKYGEDDGMKNEPYKTLGYLYSDAIADKYVKPFSEGCKTLEFNGDVTGAVISDFGVHFIMQIDELEPKTVSFEDAKEAITKQLLDEAQVKHFEETLDTWLETLKITQHRNRIRAYTGYSQYYGKQQ